MTILRSRTVSVLLMLLILGLCSLVAYSLSTQELPETSRTASAEDVSGGKSEMHATYAFEATDKRKLVGASENVFVGRVLNKVGSESTPALKPIPGEDDSTPTTQFEIETINTIKSELEGTVTVNQHGGRNEDGQFVLLEEDPLFESGKVYLINSNKDQQRGWQQVVAQPFGKVKTKSSQHKAKVVKKFEAAKQSQILPDHATHMRSADEYNNR